MTRTPSGGNGGDQLSGEAGANIVFGGAGYNVINLGTGGDTVRGSLSDLTADTIADFDTAAGGDLDAIVLETIVGSDTREVFTATGDTLDLDGDGDGDIWVTGSTGVDWRSEVDGVTRFTIAEPLFTEGADTYDLGTIDLDAYGNVSRMRWAATTG